MASHNLCTSFTPPHHFKHLLGLGVNFCLRPTRPTQDITPSINRFFRDVKVRAYFNEVPPNPEFDPRLFARSNWNPPKDTISNIDVDFRIRHFLHEIRYAFSLKKKRKGHPNLLPLQESTLQFFKTSSKYLVTKTDKNLGPAIIERDIYIQRAFQDHLLDPVTYRQLPDDEADYLLNKVTTQSMTFIYKNFKGGHPTRSFLIRSLEFDDPMKRFAHFYIIPKIHKSPWKTRPIVSYSGSLLHGMGKYLDTILQPYAQAVPSYTKSSYELKKKLEQLPPLPPNARLFTTDAVSMYTMIDTDHAIEQLSKYFYRLGGRAQRQAPMIKQLLDIIMRYNIFKFGDTTWLQLTGTAMGTPPAPTYATLYYAVHEDTFLDRFKPQLAFYARYIDDVFGIWIPCDDPEEDSLLWSSFQDAMNGFGRLTWEFTERSLSVDYLDLTITINSSGQVATKLFEKALNLYLYLPPFSAHPPGVFKGMIYGMVTRILRLCSTDLDRKAMIKKLYERLRYRGFTPTFLKDAINHAIRNASKEPKKKIRAARTIEDKKNVPLFLHLPYNALDPPSSFIQRYFRNFMETPRRKQHLKEVPIDDNGLLSPLFYSRLIVCYHRPRNLAFHLTPRQISRLPGLSPNDVLQTLKGSNLNEDNRSDNDTSPLAQIPLQRLVNPYLRQGG